MTLVIVRTPAGEVTVRPSMTRAPDWAEDDHACSIFGEGLLTWHNRPIAGKAVPATKILTGDELKGVRKRMSIRIEDLVIGQWYDGFLWNRGRQRGVATLCWHTAEGWPTGYFYDAHFRKDERFSHVDDIRSDKAYRTKKLSFEPNVLSTGEPAG